MATSGAPLPPASPHLRAVVTWAAVYPTITVALWIMQPWIGGLVLPLQTLVLTAVVVPIAAYWLVPLMLRGTHLATRTPMTHDHDSDPKENR